MPKSIIAAVFLLVFIFESSAQSMNNLKYAEGYSPSELGKLKITNAGQGSTHFILIADAGFESDYFDKLVDQNLNDYTFHLISLPGTDQLNGYPLPGGSYANQTWLKAIDSALYSYMTKQNISEAVIGGHLVISTHIAMKYALNHPEHISHTIIMAGQPYASWPSRKDPTGKTPVSIEERKGSIDYFMAPRFYKTVSDEDWNKGLYQPNHYSINKTIGEALYNKSTQAEKPVMIQLLCEYFTTDFSYSFDKVSTPTLVIKPGLSPEYLNKNPSHDDLFNNYWNDAEQNPNFQYITIPNSRLSLGHEHVNEIAEEIAKFIK